MSLDLSKLQNVKTDAGKTTARCPACAATGGDAKGNHLVIYKDGKYGCAANPDDKGHRKEIHRLARQANGSTGQIAVRSVKVPESTVVMDLGGFRRFAKVTPRPKPPPVPCSETKPQPTDVETVAAEPVVIPKPASPPMVAEEPPPEPLSSKRWVGLDHRASGYGGSNGNVTHEEMLEFLDVTEEEFARTQRV